MSRRAPHNDALFAPEDEIARRLGLTPEAWSAVVPVLERDGLPRIDPLMNARFWPAVRAHFLARYGLSGAEALAPDGKENLDAL
ncbi:hypothetical protein [Methylobacterium nigriterrae]|uniref:hypothetical protein n=1 Tax=Methylobacterium nigriterrae TaxID=3127512 RepID=UPI003013CD37